MTVSRRRYDRVYLILSRVRLSGTVAKVLATKRSILGLVGLHFSAINHSWKGSNSPPFLESISKNNVSSPIAVSMKTTNFELVSDS